MKKIIATFTVIIILSSVSCRREELPTPAGDSSGEILKEKQNPVPVPRGAPLSQQKIDNQIIEMMDSEKDFRWERVDLKTLWSAVQYNDNSLAVGYKPTGYGDVSSIIHQIDVKSGAWKAVHDALINLVITELNKDSRELITASDIIIEDDADLPIITFKLTNRYVITRLYNLENVRYLEPLGYWPQDSRYNERSTTGCSSSTEPLNTSDWTTLVPGCRLPWNFNNVNVPAAWNTAQGQGIKIGVIDAGISSAQSLLGSQFTNGYSNVSRTVTTDYTYGTSAYTTCTHGTSMSGLAAGPRNNQNASTGVAYKSSIHFIRACEDVVLDQSAEKTGVKNALVKMGKKNDVKIISMSVGTPFASSVLQDGVTFAYNKGKMLFAAAGTSFGWTTWWGVIYPAAYSQCNAITGVKENGSTCSSCHDGSQVDFTVPMERDANDNRNSLSLPLSGNVITYIGGSSAATATAAGIAALVWSAKPTLTRSEVFTCLRNTSQYYPGTSSSHGYGNLNASAAVSMALTY